MGEGEGGRRLVSMRMRKVGTYILCMIVRNKEYNTSVYIAVRILSALGIFIAACGA